jgi:hypothetical protein
VEVHEPESLDEPLGVVDRARVAGRAPERDPSGALPPRDEVRAEPADELDHDLLLFGDGRSREADPGVLGRHHDLHDDAHRAARPAELAAVGGRARALPARDAPRYGLEERIVPDDVQEGLVLAGERGLRTVLLGRRGAHRHPRAVARRSGAAGRSLAQRGVRVPDRLSVRLGELERTVPGEGQREAVRNRKVPAHEASQAPRLGSEADVLLFAEIHQGAKAGQSHGSHLAEKATRDPPVPGGRARAPAVHVVPRGIEDLA